MIILAGIILSKHDKPSVNNALLQQSKKKTRSFINCYLFFASLKQLQEPATDATLAKLAFWVPYHQQSSKTNGNLLNFSPHSLNSDSNSASQQQNAAPLQYGMSRLLANSAQSLSIATTYPTNTVSQSATNKIQSSVPDLSQQFITNRSTQNAFITASPRTPTTMPGLQHNFSGL